MSTPVPRVGFVSLGCPKATVDSERILTGLRAEGYEIVSSYAEAGLVVVNTCGFIDDAVQESLDAIGEALEENGRVIVTGCLGARAETVREAHPKVLAVTGPHAYEEVMHLVHRHLPPPQNPFDTLLPPGGVKLTPRHYAYLKISEGCNHRCSFCIIPALRGDLVSRPVGEVVAEAEKLAEAGVRELILIAQDLAAYGVDVKYRTGFVAGRPLKTRLTELLNELSGLGVWLRPMYVYPYPVVDELLPLMAEGKVLPYLDVPLQHAAPRILKAMGRPAAAENQLARIRAWREAVPELTLRSTFITGFPGETEEEFEALLAFLEEAQLDRVGCFPYSPVEGAAANALADPVPAELARERAEELMAFQAQISAARLAEKIGSETTVLVDELDGDQAIGRTPGDAPEVDGLVYLDSAEGFQPGDLVEATITGADEYDLWAAPRR